MQLLNNTIRQQDEFRVAFDIYKSTGGSKGILVGTLRGYFGDFAEGTGHCVAIKSVYGVDNERYGLANYYRNFEGITDREDDNAWADDWAISENNYLVSHFTLGSLNQAYGVGLTGMFMLDENNKTYITINTQDTLSKYFVNFRYKLDGADDYAIIGSEPTSIYDICATIYTQDKFEEENMSAQQEDNVLKIAKNTEIKKVKVEYLKQIGTTPFAQRVTEVMELPVVNNFVDFNDIADYLSLPTGMPVRNSYAENVEYIKATETYRVIYGKTLWVRGLTADGHEMNNYLDINQSFKDYYYSFVNNGVIGEDLYSWYWNSVKVNCPELAGFDDTEVYGLWGFLLIPDSYSINSFWSEAFGQRNFSGSLTWYTYQSSLTKDKYQTLMDNYNYSWISYAWGSLIGSLDGTKGYQANSYIYYVNNDNSITEFIAENGADDFNDTQGAFNNSMEDLGEFFGGVFENFGTYIFGGLGIVLLIILVLWIVRAFFKTKTAITESQQAKKRKKRKR